MKKLSLQPLSSLDHLVGPDEFYEINMESPATEVMMNFKHERPHIIDDNVSAIEAYRVMKKTHTTVALVTNQTLEFIGLINAQILTERSIIRLVANGASRDEIGVDEVMLPRNSIKAIAIGDVGAAKVKDIVQVLKEAGEGYCLVVDEDKHSICGLFDISEIGRRLHATIRVSRKKTFADLVAAVSH